MKINLKKSRTSVALTVADDKILDIIMGKDVPALNHDQVKKIIAQGIKTHTPENIKDKKIAVIIPDNTRLWARGDVFVPQIVKALFDLDVSADNIKIIIALGTHDDIEKDQFSQLAGTFCFQNIEIINSASKNRSRLVYIGQTHKKTDLYITKEAAQADHIIIFGGILHHLAAGFGGGRKYILPGIAGYESIQQNHSLAMKKDGSPHPLVRQAKLWGNPINEDMNDAADIFLQDKTCTCATIAVDGMGDIFHADAGPLHSTFMDSCKKLDQACCIHVPQKADFALISAGGHRTDNQLYQASKALFNAVNIVKPKGKIIFAAGCSQGVGNEKFSKALNLYKNDPWKLGRKLAAEFDMPSYIAFRLINILKRFDVMLVSDLSEKLTLDLSFNFTHNIEEYVKNLKGKGFVIPFAENIFPVADKL